MRYRLFTTAALVALACAAATAALAGGNGRLYQFRGTVVGTGANTLTLTVEGGNRAALRAMLGQPQTETFTLGEQSEVLVWSKGIPTVGTLAAVKAGDWVRVNVRAKRNATLADVLATPPGIVGDHGTKPNPPSQPLFLFRGTVAGAPSGGHVALHVTGGNHRALKALVGEPADQTFTYDDGTIFLRWQGKVPTVIDATQLKAGDRVTIRVRAGGRSSLGEIRSTPANRVGEHEPPAQES